MHEILMHVLSYMLALCLPKPVHKNSFTLFVNSVISGYNKLSYSARLDFDWREITIVEFYCTILPQESGYGNMPLLPLYFSIFSV